MSLVPPVLIELLRIVRVIRERHPKLLKSGLPGKREILAFNENLITPQNLDGIRKLEDAGYLLFLYELGYQLELFSEQNKHLQPKESYCQEFFSKQLSEQTELLKKAYLRMLLWNEFQHIPEIIHNPDQQHEHDELLQIHQLLKAKRQLLKLLPEYLSEPILLSQLLSKFSQQHPNILHFPERQNNTLYPNIWLKDEEDKAYHARYPRDWLKIEGAFIEKVLCDTFRWLSLVQVKKTPEGKRLSLHPNFSKELGAEAAQGNPAGYQDKTLLVQPNLEILVFQSPQLLPTLYHLEQFCAPKDGDQILRYQIEKKSFIMALQRGLTYEWCWQFLTEHSKVELPSNIMQILKGWHDQCNKIVISRQGTILEASTPEELEETVGQFPKDLRYFKLDKTNIFIPANQLSKLQSFLEQANPKRIEYNTAPPRSLSISDQLEVEVDTRLCDIYVLPFLKELAQEVEAPSSYSRSFQIRQESVQSVLESRPFEEIMTFLEKRALIFSSTAKLRLEAFADQLGPVSIENRTLLLVPNPKTLQRLLYEAGIQSYAMCIGPAAALIPKEYEKPCRELLKSFGLPNTTEPIVATDALWTEEPEDEPLHTLEYDQVPTGSGKTS